MNWEVNCLHPLINSVHFLFFKTLESYTGDVNIFNRLKYTVNIKSTQSNRSDHLADAYWLITESSFKHWVHSAMAPCLFLRRTVMSYMTEACDSVINGLSVTGQWLQLAHQNMVHCPTATMQSLQLSHHSTARECYTEKTLAF